jgi:hypothetical protein
VVNARFTKAVFSVFWTRAATVSSKQLLSCAHEADWTPFQTHYSSENLVTPGTETGEKGKRVKEHGRVRSIDRKRERAKTKINKLKRKEK